MLIHHQKEYLLICGSLLDGEAVQLAVLLVGCLAAAAYGWFIVAFGCAMFCVIRVGARHLLLSLCNARCLSAKNTTCHMLQCA